MSKAGTGEARRMTGVKFAPEIQRRIDAIVNELTERTAGAAPAMSVVVSQLVIRGLDVYERELGLTKSSKSTAA